MTQNPTTEAGRQFNEQTDGQYIEDVLAIESEARATAPAGDDPIRHATDVVIDLIERTRNDKYEPPEVSAVRATLSEARATAPAGLDVPLLTRSLAVVRARGEAFALSGQHVHWTDAEVAAMVADVYAELAALVASGETEQDR